MRISRRALLTTLLAASLAGSLAGSAFAQVSDPLPSWNEGATKKSITDFVARVTAQGSPDFVAPASRRSTTTARCGANSRSTSSLPSHSIA